MPASLHYNAVYQNQRLIYESGSAQPYKIYSITKSVVALLLGFWFSKHPQHSLASKVSDSLADYAVPDAWRALTLGDVLSQRAGLKWRELGVAWGAKNPLWRMENSPHWLQFLLEQKFSALPGKVFTYNSGASYLLTHYMQHFTEANLQEWAQEHFFSPLGIVPQDYIWETSPQGILAGGKGIMCDPEVLRKIGDFILNRGCVAGVPLISEAWLQLMLTPQHRGHSILGQYALQWWVLDNICMARGFGGQYLLLHRPSQSLGIYLQTTDFAERRDAVAHFKKLVNV